jgi:hypothetical protein
MNFHTPRKLGAPCLDFETWDTSILNRQREVAEATQ